MIIARLEDANKYAPVHRLFQPALEFLRRDDVAGLAEGRHEIDGDQLFAIVTRGIGRGQVDSPLEFHRQYIDIQYVISGVDSMGWLPTQQCRYEKFAYDTDTDLGFFSDRPSTWCRVPSGCLAIFFPEDAHAPLGGTGPFHKVVLKLLATNG